MVRQKYRKWRKVDHTLRKSWLSITRWSFLRGNLKREYLKQIHGGEEELSLFTKLHFPVRNTMPVYLTCSGQCLIQSGSVYLSFSLLQKMAVFN
jgi:hypothetical protein